mgnify:CR=1 FL=1
MSPLTDMMRKRNTFFTIQELTHGNKRKVDRIVAALQGRFEHGTITLNKGEWNIQFLDELFQFPNPQVHDDLIDSLAYTNQTIKKHMMNIIVYGEVSGINQIVCVNQSVLNLLALPPNKL